MNLTTSLNLNQSNARSSLNTQIRIPIRKLSCAQISVKQKLARALNKDSDLVGVLKSISKAFQSKLR